MIDLSPKDDQNRGEDTNISKIFLGRTPKATNHNTMDFIIQVLPQGGKNKTTY